MLVVDGRLAGETLPNDANHVGERDRQTELGSIQQNVEFVNYLPLCMTEYALVLALPLIEAEYLDDAMVELAHILDILLVLKNV